MYYTIEYKGQILDVHGYINTGTIGNWEEPSTPAELEIYKIKLGNYDVTEMLEDYHEEIEDLVLHVEHL